jgi:hypothetical protein
MKRSSVWRKSRPALRDRWRRREAGWRKQRIMVREVSMGTHRTETALRYFTRYDYLKAWRAQGGLCGFCDAPLPVDAMEEVACLGKVGTGQGINPDHDHHTRLFRSLCHGRCNRLINGNTKTTAALLVRYLGRF